MKSVVKCLQEARSELEEALGKLESPGQPLLTAEESSNDDASPGAPSAGTEGGYDPDDLAAAFFAQQAHKQQAESKLPVDAWAATIFATSTVVANEGRHGRRSASSEAGGTRTDAGEPMLDQTPLDESRTKAHDLWKVFEAAYADFER